MAEPEGLSTDEILAVRALLEQDRRTRWLWSTIRTWSLWVIAVVGGITIGLDAVKALVRRLIA